MNTLFAPGKIGSLTLPNRLVRSATAERMADGSGRPRPQLSALYQELRVCKIITSRTAHQAGGGLGRGRIV
jgi:2,4-dienoyl-CoA reductase-like NADH-dependent reductase (Old Yellow Enzyme family)